MHLEALARYSEKKRSWQCEITICSRWVSPSTMRIILTRKMGTFVGRAVPVVGWIIIAKDITEIAFRSVTSTTAWQGVMINYGN